MQSLTLETNHVEHVPNTVRLTDASAKDQVLALNVTSGTSSSKTTSPVANVPQTVLHAQSMEPIIAMYVTLDLDLQQITRVNDVPTTAQCMDATRLGLITVRNVTLDSDSFRMDLAEHVPQTALHARSMEPVIAIIAPLDTDLHQPTRAHLVPSTARFTDAQ
jgi:hypothetical protein